MANFYTLTKNVISLNFREFDKFEKENKKAIYDIKILLNNTIWDLFFYFKNRFYFIIKIK